MSYDLLIGQVTHLFRSAHTMEQLLLRANARTQRGDAVLPPPVAHGSPTGAESRSSAVRFIDPFGTSMHIPAQPWQLLSSFVKQLQAYIPPHLQEWTQIGLLPTTDASIASAAASPFSPPLPDSSPAAAAASHAAATSSSVASAVPSSSLRSADSVRSLTPSLLHMTLAHARLASAPASSPVISGDAIDLTETASPLSAAAAANEVHSADGTQLALVAYGTLTVLLRRAGASASVHSSSATPSSHSIKLPVFGLDLLSDVLTRVQAHAAARLDFDLQHARCDLFQIEKSFTLPLHMLSSRESGGADGAIPVSPQQSVFSAQLAHPDRVLLVEVMSSPAATAAASGASVGEPPMKLSVRTLTGRMFDVSVRSASDSVLELKERIATLEGLPVPQQMLMFEQVELLDSDSLSSHGLREGDTIQLLLRLREAALSPSRGGFRLECGRAGLNPLSSDSFAATRGLSALMRWTVPPLSKLRGLPVATVASLLLHTRRLLSDTYTAVHAQEIYGHSSRGKAWINETALEAECSTGARGGTDGEAGDLLDPVAAAASSSSVKRGVLKRRVHSLIDDEEDANGETSAAHGSVIALDQEEDEEGGGEEGEVAAIAQSIDLTQTLEDVSVNEDEVQLLEDSSSPAAAGLAQQAPAQRRRMHEPQANDTGTAAGAAVVVIKDDSPPPLEHA
jgi:hypothetical protein